MRTEGAAGVVRSGPFVPSPDAALGDGDGASAPSLPTQWQWWVASPRRLGHRGRGSAFQITL